MKYARPPYRLYELTKEMIAESSERPLYTLFQGVGRLRDYCQIACKRVDHDAAYRDRSVHCYIFRYITVLYFSEKTLLCLS